MIDFKSHILLNKMQFSDLLQATIDDEIFVSYSCIVVVFNHLTDFCFIVFFFYTMRVFWVI